VDQGAGPNGGDLLTQDVQPDGLPSPIANDIVLMYGPGSGSLPWTIGDPGEPNGGLYLLVADDGVNPGSLDTVGGQVPMGALSQFLDTARYELFRISEITVTGIEIHPNKGFSGFFDLPIAGTRWIRAITIVRPYATRLAAIPGSGAGAGRERTFAVVTPELAASGDHFPPYDGGNGVGSGDGSWIGGGFTGALAPGSGAATGDPLLYGGKVRQPIPLPVTEAVGNVRSGLGLPPDPVGTWGVATAVAPFTATPFSVGNLPIIRVSTTGRQEDLLPFFGFGYPTACLGWFDVRAILVGAFTGVVLGRVPEVNPNIALPYFGPGPFVVKAPGPTQNMGLGFTLHLAVSRLWFANFDLDSVEACRLTTLIDPRWTRRFEKQISDPGVFPPPGASGAGRPDRSIWGTRALVVPGGPIPEAENPGNLMDLGFRMVLFPAREGTAGEAIPDFNRPITGRDLVIDPSIAEAQSIDIDYSAGLVRLSHVPPVAPGGAIVPDGIIGTGVNNPRGEIVLFATCVPYSMEDSQLGTGSRITGDFGTTRPADLYSPQTFAQIDMVETTFVVSAPHFGVSSFGAVEIVLDRVWLGPETGVITITAGGITGIPFGRWGYTQRVTRVTGGGLTVTALGGLSSLPTVLDPTPPGGQQRGVVLRREAVFSAESPSLPSLDSYVADTTYGSSARAGVLRHRNARLFGEMDGSVTVDPMPDFSLFEHAYGTAMPSKLLRPIGNVFAPTPTGNFLGEQGLLCNLDYQTSVANPFFPDHGGAYQMVGTTTGIPSLTFSPSPSLGADDWHGIITKAAVVSPGANRGIVHLTDSFRSVTKFSLELRAGAVGKWFIGFVQDDGIGPTLDPSVGDVTDIGAMFPRFSTVALAVDMTVDSNIYFWTRGAGGDFFIPTGQSIGAIIPAGTTQAFYFVIETRYDKPLFVSPTSFALSGGVEVRLGLYNTRMEQLAGTVVTDLDRLPLLLGLRGLFYAAGVRFVFPGPTFPSLQFHGTSVVLDAWKPRIGPVLAKP
jgi:hypothetical protein